MVQRAPRPAILLVAAAFISAVVFLPSFSGEWILDDHMLVAANPYVHSLTSWTRWFTTDFFNVNAETVRDSHHLMYWRPAISATYAIDWVLGGGSPMVFHLLNLIWQAIMGALAFHVLKRWIGAPIPALVAAILFAIHPTKAESVAWISGRTDILCLICVLIATEGISRRRRGARCGLVLEVAGTIVAYLCKEQAIVLPVFVMIEVWASRDRGALDRNTLRAMLVAAIPQVVVAIGYLIIRTVVMPIGVDAASPPLVTHVLAVLESFGRFTALIAAPYDLSIQHGHVHALTGIEISAPYAILGAATLAGVVALIAVCRRRRPEISVGLGFYILTVLPTSNIKYSYMQTLVAERFLYLPLLGLALLVGCALERAAPRWGKVGYGLAIAVGITFGTVSVSRSRDFQDETQFWKREVALHPDSGSINDDAIEVAIGHRVYREALAMMARERGALNARDRDVSSELIRAVRTARVSALVAPDRDKARLGSIDQFCATLVSGDQVTAVLALDDGSLVVNTRTNGFPEARRDAELGLLGLRIEIATRLADDARAVELADTVVAMCPTCVTTVPIAIVAFAAAGRYDRAEALLASLHELVDEAVYARLFDHLRTARGAHATAVGADPEALRARATELSALELWGRAYEVLAPHVAELAQAPRVALGVAELAFRAGEPDVARRLFIAAAPLAGVDAAFAQWAASMGWQ